MENQNVLTKEGLAKLKVELENLISVERKKVIQEIKEAREQGDLSENAEFDAAREKQGQIEDRISEIEAIIENAKIVASKSTKQAGQKVRVGSKVKIKNVTTGELSTYTIVGSLETDPLNGKISNVSEVAKAILNQEKGSVVKVEATEKYDIKIMSIEN